MKKHDIENQNDIENLVNTFYEFVKKDQTIGYIFNEMVGEKWEAHLPIMYSFWASILLGTATYQGNVMHRHIELDKVQPLEKRHFEQWEKLFLETVDTLFEGRVADEAKKRATLMSQLMHFKVTQSRTQNFIQ